MIKALSPYKYELNRDHSLIGRVTKKFAIENNLALYLFGGDYNFKKGDYRAIVIESDMSTFISIKNALNYYKSGILKMDSMQLDGTQFQSFLLEWRN